MHWKDLKTFAIAVLLMIDAVFLFVIFKQRHTEAYYPKTLIDSSVSAFETSGLYVERSFLTDKKERLHVYQGVLDSERILKAAEALCTEGYLPEQEEKGIRLSGDGGTFFFGYDFSFSYYAEADAKKPSRLLYTEEWTLSMEGERKNSCARVASDFLKSFLPEKGKYDYSLVCTGVYDFGEESIAVFSVYLENMKTEHEIYCRISEGKVSAADGTFYSALPNERKKAENSGLCNILFEEKARIDALDESERKNSYTVKEISYSYGVYFDEQVFYFVPLCRITYGDGESRIYNFISGELYAP